MRVAKVHPHERACWDRATATGPSARSLTSWTKPTSWKTRTCGTSTPWRNRPHAMVGPHAMAKPMVEPTHGDVIPCKKRTPCEGADL